MGFITAAAIKRRSVTLLAAAIILVAGVFTYNSLRVELFPEIDFPLVVVTTSYPSADPEGVVPGRYRPHRVRHCGHPRTGDPPVHQFRGQLHHSGHLRIRHGHGQRGEQHRVRHQCSFLPRRRRRPRGWALQPGPDTRHPVRRPVRPGAGSRRPSGRVPDTAPPGRNRWRAAGPRLRGDSTQGRRFRRPERPGSSGADPGPGIRGPGRQQPFRPLRPGVRSRKGPPRPLRPRAHLR